MRIALTFLTLCFATLTYAKPQVYFDYKVFYTPDQSSYVSTSLQFVAGSFKFIGDGTGNLSTKVEITQVFTYKDSIVVADKYMLDSPVMKDSLIEDFYDIQRYALNPGIYTYELTIKDVISGEMVQGQQTLEVKAMKENQLMISDIEFIEDARPSEEQNNFTKSGFFMLPYLTNYFPPEIDKIAFYSEIYNADKALGENEPFMLTCGIENSSTGRMVEGIFKFKRMDARSVNPSINFVPIEKLPSGDYNLVVNVLNKKSDTLVSKKVFFQRRNDIDLAQLVSPDDLEIDPSFKNDIPWDSIPYFVGSLMPISERYESETILRMLKGTDTTLMQNYFFSYWRQSAPEDPFKAWRAYKAQVYYAERLFGTQIKYGYEADRGRVHLQYGSPNAIADRPNEPSAYPYQIWHYYRIGQRSNVRFVFYNPDLVTNDYPLLHSDMQGELQNLRWQNDLHKRDSPTDNVDDPNNPSHYGGTSQILYNGGM